MPRRARAGPARCGWNACPAGAAAVAARDQRSEHVFFDHAQLRRRLLRAQIGLIVSLQHTQSISNTSAVQCANRVRSPHSSQEPVVLIIACSVPQPSVPFPVHTSERTPASAGVYLAYLERVPAADSRCSVTSLPAARSASAIAMLALSFTVASAAPCAASPAPTLRRSNRSAIYARTPRVWSA